MGSGKLGSASPLCLYDVTLSLCCPRWSSLPAGQAPAETPHPQGLIQTAPLPAVPEAASVHLLGSFIAVNGLCWELVTYNLHMLVSFHGNEVTRLTGLSQLQAEFSEITFT